MNADHDADAMRRILAHAEELTQRDRRREAADWERQMRELMERRPAHMPPLSVAQGQGWLPIESAPRDESVLVTFAPGDIGGGIGSPGVMVAYWDAYYAEGGNGYQGGSGWVDAHSGEEPRLHYGEPTHWQPLPAAPAQPDGVE